MDFIICPCPCPCPCLCPQGSASVRAALNKTGSVLAAITVLKKICDHPSLLSERAAAEIAAGRGGEADGGSDSDESGCEARSLFSVSHILPPRSAAPVNSSLKLSHQSHHSLDPWLLPQEAARHPSFALGASCKTAFVVAALQELAPKGHRVLVFSQARWHPPYLLHPL